MMGHDDDYDASDESCTFLLIAIITISITIIIVIISIIIVIIIIYSSSPVTGYGLRA